MTEYSPDAKRVCEYLQRITNNQIGCGDDPVGFLIASHAHSRREVEGLRRQLDEKQRSLAAGPS